MLGLDICCHAQQEYIPTTRPYYGTSLDETVLLVHIMTSFVVCKAHKIMSKNVYKLSRVCSTYEVLLTSNVN